MAFPDRDWTCDEEGRSNSSERFKEICKEVERLIRDDANMLIMGRADRTAGLIVARLAHKFNFGPFDDLRELARNAQDGVENLSKEITEI